MSRKYSSNAERQRAYRERQRAQRNAESVTASPIADEQTGELLEIARRQWRKEFFHPGVVEQLERVAEIGGYEAALIAASAVRRTIDAEREWAALRQWADTTQGHKLKRLVDKRDPLVVEFLEAARL